MYALAQEFDLVHQTISPRESGTRLCTVCGGLGITLMEQFTPYHDIKR